jgi:peptidoglycan/LPS O-acetylase OafA/YrhL
MLAHRVYVLWAARNSRVMRLLGIGILGLFPLLNVGYSLIWHLPFLDQIGSSHSSHVVVKYLMPFALPFVFALTKDSKLDERIGELSYPLYLSHFLVLELLHHQNPWVDLAACLAASIVLAVVFARLERLYRRGRNSQLPSAASRA